MPPEDHDILIALNEKVGNIQNLLENHLKHHWAVTISLIGITGSAVVTTLILIIRLAL